MRTSDALHVARILIVDDEQANVRLLERLLLSGGFSEMRGTTDPADALRLMHEYRPDLVLLDLNMPRMDGFEVMKAIRAGCAPDEYLPILVLTADMTRATKERALATGATDFITKPVERTEVLLRTRNLLQSRHLHLALKDENKALEAKLVYQAFHDSLTGLANRVLFSDRVDHALKRAERGHRSVLLLLDLDDFKAVNDLLGHAEGDNLLQVVSERLMHATRGCDTVSRIGGDEFAVLLDDVEHVDEALRVVDRIMEVMKEPVTLQGREVIVGCSIGMAHVNPENSVDEVLRNADVAMYRAKDAGKGCHAIFEPSMYAAVVERMERTADLRHAVDRGELRVLYQPIVDLRSGNITGVEALTRWQRGAELASPATFIPLAEETGIIVPIGRWVLMEACRQARRWDFDSQSGKGGAGGPTMSVNVSARQLYDPSFTMDVAATLAETGLSPERLILEITETVLVGNATAVERLHELKALGVRLAIDDFGTGYSNLSYLQRFPLDIIKIDKSFVAKVAERGEAKLASIIVDLATTLKLQTVAEGIERADQRDHLIALGCASGQGYLFAKPIEADAITDMLKSQRQRRPLQTARAS